MCVAADVLEEATGSEMVVVEVKGGSVRGAGEDGVISSGQRLLATSSSSYFSSSSISASNISYQMLAVL